MSLHDFNLAVFHLINASDAASTTSINIAIWIADTLFYIVVFAVLIAWLKGGYLVKKQIIKATLFTLCAFALSQMISSYFYYPRPFVMDVGRTIIAHAPNGSFPSDHMLFFSTITFAYLFSHQKKIGYLFLILAWLVAWSRVYLGVHFPLDMLGAFTLGLALNLLGWSVWEKYGNHLVNRVLAAYQYIFSSLIKKGYIR